MIFEFDSGSPNHPEGFGAWRVRVDGDRISIVHQVRENVRQYPEMTLSDHDQRELQDSIDAARLDEQRQTSSQGVPDQPIATFRVGRGDARTVRVWIDGRKTDDPVVKLLHRLADLIEKLTGTRPVLT
jgi:hypothetical protein